MTPESFAYWLQGFLELQDPKQLDSKQIQMIKDHLKLAFKKETPNRRSFDTDSAYMPLCSPSNQLFC